MSAITAGHLSDSPRLEDPSCSPTGSRRPSPTCKAPQAEFDIPYDNLGQSGPSGQVATLYATTYGYDEKAMAKTSVSTPITRPERSFQT
jgi:hypothetical protein